MLDPEKPPTQKRKYAFNFDTRNSPGSVEVTYIEFSKELVPSADFDGREFRIIDTSLPEFRALASLLKDNPDGKNVARVSEPDPAPKKPG